MRGRKPTPTARKRLEGNPGRRPLNAREPDLPRDPPAPPDDPPPPELETDPVAAAEWRRLFPILQRAQAITAGDRGSLLALCQQWSRYLEANGRVAASGLVVMSPHKYPMPNPYIAIANKALGNCVKLWVELGLTPSARSRVTTTAAVAPIGDPFAEFDAPTFTH
jgi:P27 family predicted phage terminase small subunit